MPISEVYNEDNMIGMARYPDKFFDLAIVDPPYGIGASKVVKYAGSKFTAHKKKNWDNEVPTIEYFNELKRVSVFQIIWGGNYYELPLCADWIIWDKVIPDGCSYREYELAWNNSGKKGKIFKLTASWNNGGNSSDRRAKESKARIHPTQKPVALYKWLLTHYAQPGNKILDTHMGSQSSRIAAFQMGFDYWGWEIDKEYFEAGNKRFEEQTKQQTLFPYGK
jgi:site-specific DNA-methyltransferase (adenine-specific)